MRTRTYEIPELETETTKVHPIRLIDTVVGDYMLPMPSDVQFHLQKTYVKEPSRNNSGAFSNFPDKFFVPYFVATWNVISFKDYSKILRLIEPDEVMVEYYNTRERCYKHNLFYIQQPEYNKLYTMQSEYDYVTNLQLTFAATMNDVSDITINYDANGGTGTIDDVVGQNGDEFVVDSGEDIALDGYTLVSWNSAADGSGDMYVLGSTAVMTYNVTLYAQWEVSNG